MSHSTTQQKRIRIKRKIRAAIFGTAERPRMTVSRSNKFISAQLIDDTAARTLVAATDMVKKGAQQEAAQKITKMQGAVATGKKIAELAKAAGITSIVFDRNGFKYAGRIKACADAAREGGLIF